MRELCAKWRVALDEEALAEFHMAEIASDEHRYGDWSAERRNRLDRFVGILTTYGAVLCAFNYSTVTADEDKLFKDTYEGAMARALIIASSLCDKTGERASLVFAKTGEIKQELIGRYFDKLHWGEYFDSVTTQKSSGNPALQAAEIPTRELKRLMQDGLVTHSFRQLCLSGKPIRFWPENPFVAARVPDVPFNPGPWQR